jgi:hypothetical protein
VFRTEWATFPGVASTRSLRRWPAVYFKVCKNQTYALCTAARCNVFDGIAYCRCDEKHGDSISLPFPMGRSADVCSINAAGADNKIHDQHLHSARVNCFAAGRPRGLHLLRDGSGAYAQCEGGRCFRSTEETTFPGFDKPVPQGQIIEQQDGLDDLCRRPDWHGPGSGGPAERQSPAINECRGTESTGSRAIK